MAQAPAGVHFAKEPSRLPATPPPAKKAKTGRVPRILHVFSGPSNREDGLRQCLAKMGWTGRDVDIVNVDVGGAGPGPHDLTNDLLWEELFAAVRAGEYDALFLGTECTTFSRARERPPGPPPLRNLEHPYGFPKSWVHPDGTRITPAQLEQTRVGTYFALQSAKLATIAHAAKVPWALENPEPWPGHISMFWLPEFTALAELPGVQHVDFDQCCHGAETSKPTRILFWGMVLAKLEGRCQHPRQWWQFRDFRRRTKWCFTAHPPLAGRVRESGEPATKLAGAYPGGLNAVLAEAFAATRQSQRPNQAGTPRQGPRS